MDDSTKSPNLRAEYLTALQRIETLERQLDDLQASPSWRVGRRIVTASHLLSGNVLKGRIGLARFTLPGRAHRCADDPEEVIAHLLHDAPGQAPDLVIHIGRKSRRDRAPTLDPVGNHHSIASDQAVRPGALEAWLTKEQYEHVALLHITERAAGHRILAEFPWHRLRPRFVLLDTRGLGVPHTDLAVANELLERRVYYTLYANHHPLVTPVARLHRWSHAPPAATIRWARPHGCLVGCQRRSDLDHFRAVTRIDG